MPARSPVDWAVSKLRPESYGKFLHNGYPFLFWEPDAEADIGRVAAAYLSGPLTAQGLHFAINMDPVQFSMYASTTARAARSHAPASVTAAAMPVSLDAARTVLPTANVSVRTTFVRATLVMLETDPASGAHALGFVFLPKDAAAAIPDIVWQPLPAELGAPVSATLRCTAQSSSATECIVETMWASTSGQATTMVQHSVLVKAGTIADIDSATAPVSMCKTCGPVAMYHAVAAAGNFSFRVAGALRGGDLCLAAVNDNLGLLSGTMDCVSLSPANTTTTRLTLAAVRDEDSAGVVVLAAWEEDEASAGGSTVHGALLLYRSEGTRSGLSSLLAGPRYLQSGRRPMADALSAADDGQLAWFALSVDDAFCYNTESGNKQPAPATCDQTPEATPFVLSATAGSATAWRQQLALNASGPVLSPCGDIAGAREVLVHSVYDMGTAGCLALQRDPSTGSTSLFATHLGIPAAATPPSATAQCGLPATYNGTAVSRWQLA